MDFSCPKCGYKQERTECCISCGVIFSKIKDWGQNSNANEPTFERVVLTTAPSFEGYKIAKTLEIVTSECIVGMNAFAGMTDGRSEATQHVLRDARRTCLTELKKEAFDLGANAVIAVAIDFREFNGQGKPALLVGASGTAVKVVKGQL